MGIYRNVNRLKKFRAHYKGLGRSFFNATLWCRFTAPGHKATQMERDLLVSQLSDPHICDWCKGVRYGFGSECGPCFERARANPRSWVLPGTTISCGPRAVTSKVNRLRRLRTGAQMFRFTGYKCREHENFRRSFQNPRHAVRKLKALRQQG